MEACVNMDRRNTMKKQLAVCMSLILGGSTILNPIMMMPVRAADSATFVKAAAEFSMGSMTAINNGVGALEGSSELVSKIKVADDFSMNAKVKLTGTSNVETIFFIGDSTKNDNYVVVYVSPNGKVGIEARNGDTRTLNVSKDSDVNLKDGNIHNVTFTQKKGSYYRFYIDGKVVLDGVTNSAFCNGLIPNANFVGIGNGKRSSGNGYPFTGELGSIQVFDSAISENQIFAYNQGVVSDDDVAYKTSDYFFHNESTYAAQGDIAASSLSTMDAGSISIRYRAGSVDSSTMSLFSLSDSASNNYLTFYVSPANNSLGVLLNKDGTASDWKMTNTILSNKKKSVQNTDWHTLTVVKSNAEKGDKQQRYSFYLDGVKLDFYSNKANFFNNIPNADTVSVGFTKTKDDAAAMKFTGAIDGITVYNKLLTDDEAMKEDTISFVPKQVTDMKNAMKTEPESLFYSGYYESSAYRIPALLQTKDGTTLAAIDKRNTGAGDAGNIDTFVRRREAGTTTWDDPIMVADLVDKNNTTPSAFLIDPSMLQDKETGRIYLLVDMFPESSGLMNTDIISAGSGYTNVDGVDYQTLYDANNATYTIRENGVVYDLNGDISEYRVITESEAPYKELGNIYKNGEYVGNMYIFSGTDKGELHVLRAQYLWLSHSDDDGKTWSQPKDITPQVKQDWMKFIGTGPGVGLQLEDGTLTFPVYTASANVGGSQASAMIRSSDGGETWELGESPVKAEGHDRVTMNNGGYMLTESQAIQLNNGDVKLFMRNTSGKVKVATSHDGGETWSDVKQIPEIYDAYCQLSVIHYEKDGKEYVALMNPGGSGRNNGKVYLGEVSGSDITWTANKQLNTGAFAYSCLASLGLDEHGDMKFGALYEANDRTGNISLDYTEFDENYIKAGTVATTLQAPNLVDKTVTRTGDTLKITLTFDQIMMAAGNPAMNLAVGSTEFKANYVSGSGTSVLSFEANIDDTMFGIVEANGMDTSNGVFGNIKNETCDIVFDVVDLTEVKIVGVTASSEHSTSTAPNTDGAAINAIDGNPNTYWHSKWGDPNVTLPQSLTLNLGEVKDIYKFGYLPRQNSASGHVLDFELYVSKTENGEYTKVYAGKFANTYNEQFVEFTPVKAQYIRLKITNSSVDGSTNVAEARVFAYTDGLFGNADKSVLEAKVSEAQSIIEHGDNYTTATKDALQAIIVQANTVLADKASQAMVQDVITKLDKAISNLIDVSRIKEAIEEADGLQAASYTEETWTAFQTALTEIKNSYNDVTTKRGVTDFVVKLDFEKGKLVKSEITDEDVAVYKKILGAAITKAQDITGLDKLNGKVKAMFDARLKEAVAVYANSNATATQLQNAWQNLAEAMHYLDFKADKTDLTKLVADCNALDLSIYKDDANMAAYKEALRNATDVLANENSLDTSLMVAFNQLSEAKSKLVLLDGEIDTIVIDYVISKSDVVMNNKEKYDTAADSWSIFEAALANAKRVRAGQASQGALDAAASVLANAYENVRLIANEDTLGELKHYVAMIDEVNANEYRPETMLFLMQSRAVLQNLIDQGSFTIGQYEHAVSVAAEVQLRIIQDKEVLEEPTQPSDPTDVNDPVDTETPLEENEASVVTKGSTRPATGDATQGGLFASGMIGAGLVAIAAIFKRRNNK